MPRKSLHGRTCGVSRDGGRARALQPSRRSSALQVIHLHCLNAPYLRCAQRCQAGKDPAANR
ncbi:hypothetical protein BI317_02485 [Xanthomonas hortorum pv. gardneri]|nr:hypothetical protein BI317_02485 [Xanthomonas hortorum pv. gardneri]